VLDVTGWTEEQRRAYILADNQTTLESAWDEDMLKIELKWLDDAGVDMALTGFDDEALALALGNIGGGEPPEPDPLKVKLADRFGVPPFSVLRASEGWWQDRKRAWLALGIASEVGRGDNLIGRSLQDMLSQILHIHYSEVVAFIAKHRDGGMTDDQIIAEAHKKAGTKPVNPGKKLAMSDTVNRLKPSADQARKNAIKRGGLAKSYNDGAALGKGGLADQVAAKATARRKAKEAQNGEA
jgi:hypothetical protein